MLRQENATDGQQGYVSTARPMAVPDQTRVTTDELISAVAEIEARRDAGQRWQADTIALGDAVHQLGLNMSPAELLAEVEAQRSRLFAEARQSAMMAARKSRSRGAWVVVALAALAFVLLSFGLVYARQEAMPPAMATPAIVEQPPPVSGSTLQSLPEGGTGFITLQSAYAVNHGADLSQIGVSLGQETLDQNLNVFQQLWAVKRLNGGLYLQGWGVRGRDNLVHSISSIPLKESPNQTTVTLPLSDLTSIKDPTRVTRVTTPMGQVQTVEVIDFTPDQARNLHLNE